MGEIIIAIIARIIRIFIDGFVVFLLWNGTLIFILEGISEISYLQAVGVYLLANLLFKNNTRIEVDE